MRPAHPLPWRVPVRPVVNPNVPGWAEYMDTLRALQADDLVTPAAALRLVSAGKALGFAAFEAGADAMESAAADLMRQHRAAGGNRSL